MKSRRRVLSTLAFSLAACLAGVSAVTAEPPPSPHPGQAQPPVVWLKGAFGRVPGGEPATPSASAPDGRALDTWMRRAPMTLESDVASGDVLALSVVARPLDSAAAEESLSNGATVFEGPDRPGLSVITASLSTEPLGTTEHAWLVETPDRQGGPELLFDIPGPAVELTSSLGRTAGLPGHGCYAYLCVEVGLRPPPETLEPLPIEVGETPTITVGDGSAVVGWKGTLEPLGDRDSDGLSAEVAYADEAQAAPELTGLEPTAPGEWLLELLVEYDRERGWQWFLYRLISD
jgi:hypothetical protein